MARISTTDRRFCAREYIPPIYALAVGVKNGRRGSVGVCFSAESENMLADLGMGMATGVLLTGYRGSDVSRG